MSDIVLAIIELDTFPNDVARRAAWIAKRYGYDLELMFSDPTLGVLRDSYLVSSQAQQIAENIREAQEKILQDLADSIAASGLTIATSVSHEKPAADAIVARAIEIEPKFEIGRAHV